MRSAAGQCVSTMAARRASVARASTRAMQASPHPRRSTADPSGGPFLLISMVHVSRNSELVLTFADYDPELWLLRYEHRGPGGGQDHVRRAPSGLAKRSPAVPAPHTTDLYPIRSARRATVSPRHTFGLKADVKLGFRRSTRLVRVGVPSVLTPPPDRPSRGRTEMAGSREREMAGWTVPAPQRVVFCNNCGTLMEEPTFANTNVLCRMCGTVTPSKGAALASLTTNSRACTRLTRLPLRSI